jgi:cysteine desulfurase / selenocysteine lyase
MMNMDWQALREEFPVTRNYNFQNHAAVAPVSRRSAEAAMVYFNHARDNSYIHGGFYRHADRVRSQVAQLINAKPDEVTFCKNTSEGLSMVANGLSWNNGDNVVTSNAEFAANMYPWMALRHRGVQVRTVFEEEGRIPIQRIFEAIDSRTRVVTISSVQYASGFRTDLATLGDYCASKGVLLCVDAMQSLGAFPIDVKGMNIDFLACDGHKWLCGPEGIGIFFVRKELQGHLRPTSVGWMSVKEPFNFSRYNFEFADSAKRYDSGSYNLAGIYALGGAIDLIQEIGVEAISRRLLQLTTRLVEGVRNKGYRVFSSREQNEASGIVSFFSDVHAPEPLQSHLQNEHRIIIAVRGGRLRSSPHVYNTEKEIDQLIEALPKH